MAIKASDMDLAGLRDLMPSTQELRLEGGKLPSVAITVQRNDNGILQWQADGEFVGLSLAGKPAIHEGQGKFHSDEAGVQFRDLSMVILAKPGLLATQKLSRSLPIVVGELLR